MSEAELKGSSVESDLKKLHDLLGVENDSTEIAILKEAAKNQGKASFEFGNSTRTRIILGKVPTEQGLEYRATVRSGDDYVAPDQYELLTETSQLVSKILGVKAVNTSRIIGS